MTSDWLKHSHDLYLLLAATDFWILLFPGRKLAGRWHGFGKNSAVSSSATVSSRSRQGEFRFRDFWVDDVESEDWQQPRQNMAQHFQLCEFAVFISTLCPNAAITLQYSFEHISIWISMTWKSRLYTQYHPIDHWKSFVLQEFCCARTFEWLNCDIFATCWGYISEETPALVVVPFSVLSNWQTELEYFVRWI